MKNLKSKYLTIDTDSKIVTLYDYKPNNVGFLTVVEDCEIQVDNGELTITGYKWEWNFAMVRTWLSDLKESPEEQYLRFWYKSIKDFFNGIKSPYVKKGWYKVKNGKYYQCAMHGWLLVL